MLTMKTLINKYKTSDRLLLFATRDLLIDRQHLYDLGLMAISSDAELSKAFLESKSDHKKERGIIAAGIVEHERFVAQCIGHTP